MKKHEPIFGTLFLLFMMLYTCCGCAKEAAVAPAGECYTCAVQAWEERQDGYASEDTETTVDLCGQTEAMIHAYESKHTYAEKRPNQFGILTMYHSRAICSKK